MTDDTDTYEYTYYDGVIFREGENRHDRWFDEGWVPATGVLFPSEEEMLRRWPITREQAFDLMGLNYEESEAYMRRVRWPERQPDDDG